MEAGEEQENGPAAGGGCSTRRRSGRRCLVVAGPRAGAASYANAAVIQRGDTCTANAATCREQLIRHQAAEKLARGGTRASVEAKQQQGHAAVDMATQAARFLSTVERFAGEQVERLASDLLRNTKKAGTAAEASRMVANNKKAFFEMARMCLAAGAAGPPVISVERICALHSILLDSLHPSAGRLRNVDVQVGSRRCCSHAHVRQQLEMKSF